MYRINSLSSGNIYVGATPTNVTAGMKLIADARENRKRVLDASTTVEAQVSIIILSHFFPDRSTERRHEFDAMILRSDWCSFSAKRKLLNRIIESQRLLTPRDKTRYDKLLKDVTTYRNAFIHGDLSSDSQAVFLSYFEGAPRHKELTDDFWKQIEKVFADAFWFTNEISDRSGASNRADAPGRSVQELKLDAKPSEAPEIFPKPPVIARITYTGDDLDSLPSATLSTQPPPNA